jgi:hypothetical protein
MTPPPFLAQLIRAKRSGHLSGCLICRRASGGAKIEESKHVDHGDRVYGAGCLICRRASGGAKIEESKHVDHGDRVYGVTLWASVAFLGTFGSW